MIHLGLISTIFYWSYVLVIIYENYRNASVPISDYMLTGYRRKLYVSVATVSFSLFYVFTIFWLLPSYQLHWSSYILMSLAFVFQIATTWIVRNEKRLNQYWHDMTARISGILAFILLPYIAFSPVATQPTIATILVLFPLLIVLGGYLRRVNRRYYLPLQVTLFGTYYALIILATYSY